MSAERTTISLPAALFEKAKRRREELHFSTLSDYIQDLIRNDILRQETAAIKEDASDYKPDSSFRKQEKKVAR